MNIFLDTSSLAKLYLDEDGSNEVRNAVQEAEVIATSAISYVEMYSVVARRLRSKLLTRMETKRILDVFEMDWTRYGKINVDAELLKRAGKLIIKYPLRALDAVQLACAVVFQNAIDEPILFLTSDERLRSAAKREKLKYD